MSSSTTLLRAIPRSCQRCSSLPILPQSPLSRFASSSPWPSKTHLKPPPSIPPPLPALYPQKVILSDGSTFTSYTTAPTPSIYRMTRDVTNNPLWAPGTESRGLGEGAEEGRVGRFRRKFDFGGSASGGHDLAGSSVDSEGGKKGSRDEDFSWMSEGAKEEKVGAKQMGGPQKSKGGKKK